MCGRYSLLAHPADIEEFFSYKKIDPFPPRYNIAPTQPILMIAGDATGHPAPHLVRWGLIPSWVKDPDDFTLIVNARSETAAEKPSFRAAMRHRRALVPASGFYEWHRPDDRKQPKQPYWIRPDPLGPNQSGLVFFAGLMETWTGSDGSEIDTGCILTTRANNSIGRIHDRMPVVIQPSDFDRWLDCAHYEPRDVKDLLAPVGDDYFEAIAVSGLINKVANAGPEVQEPGLAEGAPEPAPRQKKPGAGGSATARKDDGQFDLF
jgi:putative SOS response-associated peptidase YedK